MPDETMNVNDNCPRGCMCHEFGGLFLSIDTAARAIADLSGHAIPISDALRYLVETEWDEEEGDLDDLHLSGGRVYMHIMLLRGWTIGHAMPREQEVIDGILQLATSDNSYWSPQQQQRS